MASQAIEDDVKAKEIDKEGGAKNHWSKEWPSEKLEVEFKDGERTVKVTTTMGEAIHKVGHPGYAFCQWCHQPINYGGSGKKAIMSHILSRTHKDVLQSKHTYLGSKGLTAAVLAVIAEQCWSFTSAPVLVDLAKLLAQDKEALSGLTMSDTSASYKMRYGLAETFTERTVKILRNTYFSLNADESTNTSGDRVLTLLVRYYKVGHIITEHLCSLELVKVDSASVLSAITNFFEQHNIPWETCISVLLDSCNVMRGSKNGVEKQLRQDYAPHLLDIDGDICHHIHNSARKFCEPFGKHLENLFIDIFNEFERSATNKDFLQEISFILGEKFSPPQKYIAHRWLSCCGVAQSTLLQFHVLTVVKALLSIFHGPTVELSFSTMSVIVDKTSNCMKVEIYSALQTVKHALKATGQSACANLKRRDPIYTPVNHRMCRKLQGTSAKNDKNLKKKSEEVQKKQAEYSLKQQEELSKQKKKRLLAEAEKKARAAHRLAMRSKLQALVLKRKEAKGKKVREKWNDDKQKATTDTKREETGQEFDCRKEKQEKKGQAHGVRSV